MNTCLMNWVTTTHIHHPDQEIENYWYSRNPFLSLCSRYVSFCSLQFLIWESRTYGCSKSVCQSYLNFFLSSPPLFKQKFSFEKLTAVSLLHWLVLDWHSRPSKFRPYLTFSALFSTVNCCYMSSASSRHLYWDVLGCLILLWHKCYPSLKAFVRWGIGHHCWKWSLIYLKL